MALLSGGISFDDLKISYSKPNPPILLATAGEMDIGFNFLENVTGKAGI